MADHVCVDCIAERAETAPRPIATPHAARFPRCATHLRQHERQLKKNARAGAVQRQRGISGEDSVALLIFQGGTCWLCRKATGATKSLAHDHDHKHCSGETSCADCLRGRLCGPCNQFIGRLGDSPEAAQRLVGYLTGDTPWRRLVAERWFSLRWRAGVPVIVHHIQQQAFQTGEVWYSATWRDLEDGGVWSLTRLPTITDMLLDISDPLPSGMLRHEASTVDHRQSVKRHDN